MRGEEGGCEEGLEPPAAARAGVPPRTTWPAGSARPAHRLFHDPLHMACCLSSACPSPADSRITADPGRCLANSTPPLSPLHQPRRPPSWNLPLLTPGPSTGSGPASALWILVRRTKWKSVWFGQGGPGCYRAANSMGGPEQKLPLWASAYPLPHHGMTLLRGDGRFSREKCSSEGWVSVHCHGGCVWYLHSWLSWTRRRHRLPALPAGAGCPPCPVNYSFVFLASLELSKILPS